MFFLAGLTAISFATPSGGKMLRFIGFLLKAAVVIFLTAVAVVWVGHQIFGAPAVPAGRLAERRELICPGGPCPSSQSMSLGTNGFG